MEGIHEICKNPIFVNICLMETKQDIHEAITKIPATKNKMKGKVMDVIEKGYTLNEKVIRFAKVVVGE